MDWNIGDMRRVTCHSTSNLFKFCLSGITVNWFYAFDEDFWFLNYFTVDQMRKILYFWYGDAFHKQTLIQLAQRQLNYGTSLSWTILKKQIAFPYFSGLNGSVATKQLSSKLLFGPSRVSVGLTKVRIGVSVKNYLRSLNLLLDSFIFNIRQRIASRFFSLHFRRTWTYFGNVIFKKW